MNQAGMIMLRKSNLQTGGVEMQMYRIALYLKNNLNYDIHLGTDDPDGHLGKLFRSGGMKVFQCSLSGKFYLAKAALKIASYAGKNNISILQAHMFRESIVCRLVKIFKPKLIHYFRVETYIDCSKISDAKKNVFHRLAKLTDKWVNDYFANGIIAARELEFRSGISPAKIHTIYNGVEQLSEQDTNAIDRNNFSAVMVANLIPGKGHEVLFKAIAALMKDDININVTLFGDVLNNRPGDNFRDQLVNSAASLGISRLIHFRGFSFNLASDLTGFTTVLLPSDTEGTPNSILEAMSARKLVITSDAGELPFIIENGISGFVHPAGDFESLYKILKLVITGYEIDTELVRDNGFRRWEKMFSLNGMMQQLRKFYE